jgi:CBS-domain-containing membrane protein
MNRRDNVLDLVKAAFVVLIIKVTASSSVLMPWSSLVDNLAIAFAIGVTFAKLVRLTMPLGRLLALAILSMFGVSMRFPP